MDRNLEILDPYLNPVKILRYDRVTEYVKNGYFFCEDRDRNLCLVITDLSLLNEIKTSKKYKIFIISLQDFYYVLEQNFSKYNIKKASFDLGFSSPNATAKNINYLTSITKIILPLLAIFHFSKQLFLLLNYIIFLSQNLLKLFLFIRVQFRQEHRLKNDLCSDYPIYSILVPMYKEASGATVIIEYLQSLDYPVALLDIKLVIEADDYDVMKIIDSIVLPDYMHVIKVPYSLPRTKPKALNYAMQYVRGKYVVIYDVEDRPEKDQLIKAVDAFNSYPENVICVQAKLNFYNKNTNLLSKCCSMEYKNWFDFLLPGLALLELPVPLGGNSNHFKVDQIRKLGLWDAYNVTEDADFGLRLFMHGFRTRIIDSYTFEEAPTEIHNWLNQRSRWIKGFLQTFFVFLIQDKKLKEKMTICSKIATYIFIGFSTYSFFILPWFFAFGNSRIFLYQTNIYITFLYLIYSALLGLSLDKKNIKLLDFSALLFWPFYFLLHIIGAYKALWELLTNPFSWNKTKHKIHE